MMGHEDRAGSPARSDGGFWDALDAPEPITRRRMIGFLIAAPTLVAASSWVTEEAIAAPLKVPQPTDSFDLTDFLRTTSELTKDTLTIGVAPDGTVSFAMPRTEVGQGIITAISMIVADEMGVPIEKVKVTQAPVDPKYQYNYLTGGSATIHSLYDQVRMAAGAARGRVRETAATRHGGLVAAYDIVGGDVVGPKTREPLGDYARLAAVKESGAVRVQLRQQQALKLTGTEQKRLDAPAAVRGKKVFTMDLEVPNALPTMVCRPPTINGTAEKLENRDEIRRMPGVTDVAVIPHVPFLVPGGVAVRAETFGQCIDAIRAMKVTWRAGTARGRSNDSVLSDLRGAELPMPPALPGKVVDKSFIFHFRPGDPLETNTAIADVRKDGAEIWSCLKTPGYFHQQVASRLGLPLDKVKVNNVEGGGSFGRHLFADAAFEAAEISRAIGKPVKLQWARSDNTRQGRAHPMATSRVRAVSSDDSVVSYDFRHTSVQTDYTHGLGEAMTSNATMLPGGNFIGFSQSVWTLTASVPYDFGATSHLINEIYEPNEFNTSSVRNIYSPDVRTAGELVADEIAKQMGKDPVAFRLEYAKDDRMRAVIRKAADAGKWGRSMPAGFAQGFGIHEEYKGRAACLVEVDTRDVTRNRKIAKVPTAYTGPRVIKVVFAVDVGRPINPLGIRAQMMGGIMDAIAQVFGYGLHLKDGAFQEASWSNAHYTRQWNVPPEIEVIVMPATTERPGGAGEFGVAAAMAATACAFARATGKMPTEFPVNFREPLTFTPFPQSPPIPESPRDGLKKAGVTRPKAKRKTTKRKTTKRS